MSKWTGRIFCSEAHLAEVARFVSEPNALKEKLNTPQHRIEEKALSPRVINHWIKQGLLDDRREGQKGWHLYSDSDRIWIRIITKLRSFGMPFEKILVTKEMIEFMGDEHSTRPLLDFYLGYIMAEKKPATLMVFENGEIDFGTQPQIQFSMDFGALLDDYFSIDLARIAGLTKGVSYMQNTTKNAAEELLKDGASSVTVESRSGKYVLSSRKRFDNRTAALAEKSLMKFGEMREILTNGKSKFELTKSTIIRK
jgi:hypothetical protein